MNVSYYLCECLKKEIRFKTSRSSGPGGQHANKTESRVELSWSPMESACMNDKQKHLVMQRLASRLTEQGVVILASEEHRSQYQNKKEVRERFLALISASLVIVKKRKSTRPTRSSVERRIKNKKIRGELKRTRGNRPGD